MSFPYKNPISPNQLSGQQSLNRTKTYGTSYSTLSTGGFMEVYSLDQLYYTIPSSTYGPIEFSGNSIPITFSKGSGTTFSFDTLTLQPDNISSGRRKLGMLVYVREVDQIYQYNIDNYFNLFTAATASTGTVVISDFGTTVKSNSAAGIAFINAWTANTIDGVGGITNPTAVWKKYYGSNLAITGGTFNTITSTLTLTNITGGTQNLTGFGTGGGGGSTITGGTFDKNTETLTLSSSGGSIYITGFTDVFVTGGTYNGSTLTFTNNSGGTFNVTGITASTSSTFTGGTVPGPTDFIAGLTANTFSTSLISDSSQIQSVDVDTRKLKDLNNIASVDWDGRILTDATPTPSLDWENRVLKDLSGNNSVEYSTRELVNSGGVHWLNWETGVIDTFTTIKSSTISATTYQNLPTDIRVTGATYSNNTFTYRNNTGGTFSVLFNTVTGLTINGNLSVTGTTSSGIISATTYQNLPTDIRVTGGTYSFGTSTFTNNTGGTFSVTGFSKYFVTAATPTGYVLINGDRWYNLSDGTELVYVDTGSGFQWVQPNTGGQFLASYLALSGGTVTGATNFTAGLTANTISATTYVNLPTDIRVTGSTYSNNTFTYTNNTGGTFNVLFNTITGLTTNGNLSVTGTTTLGNGTFTKAGFATGDVLLDNSGTDTPGVLFYYANNSNYGIDSWNGSFDVLSGQLVRITNKLNETGGAVKMAIDTSGNLVMTGFIKANAWRAGQVVNDIMLSNTEVTISTTTIATSTSDTDFLTYSYTPLSSTSYLVIHYHLASFSFEGGTGNDSYFSRIKVDGAEITYSRQSTVNGNRTGVLFPLTGRYTNSNTTAKSIVVACRRDSADDSITIVNSSSSMWLRITEIAR